MPGVQRLSLGKSADMSHLLKQVLVIVAIALSAWQATVWGQSANKADPLRPYTTCKLPDKLDVKEIARRPKRNDYRYVTSAEGAQKVSVVDGYRQRESHKRLEISFIIFERHRRYPNLTASNKPSLDASRGSVFSHEAFVNQSWRHRAAASIPPLGG